MSTLRVTCYCGALLVVAAVLTGCGGSGSAPPTQNSVPTPSPSPSPASSSTKVVTTGSTAQTATFTTIGGGYTGSVTLPPSATATSVTLTLSLSQPFGTPSVTSVRRMPESLGSHPSAVAFISVTASAGVTFLAGPALNFTLAETPAAGTVFAVGIYDPTAPASQWQFYAGSASASGNTASFTSTAGLTFKAGVAYTFVLYSSSALPTPSPFPSPGAISLSLAGNAFGNSAVVTIDGVRQPPVGIAPPPRLTITAPSGNVNLQIASFNSFDGSGTPLSIGSTSVNVIAGRTTQATISMSGVMVALSVLLNPSVETVGTTADAQIVPQPMDAAGDSIAGSQYVDASGNTPAFTASTNDASGHAQVTRNPTNTSPGILHYDGANTTPPLVTVTSGTIKGSATLYYSPVHDVFAIENICCGAQFPGMNVLSYFNAGSSTPVWSQNLPYSSLPLQPAAFDASGSVWFSTPNSTSIIGYRSDGSLAGTITLSEAETLLAFDAASHLYTATATDVREYTISASLVPTLVNTITPTSPACAAATDSSSNLYVITCGSQTQVPGLYEYPAGSNMYTSYSLGTYYDVSTDSAGDVFASSLNAVEKWRAGTLGSAPPTAIPFQAGKVPYYFAATAGGDVCGGYGQPYTPALAGWSAHGPSIPVCPIVPASASTRGTQQYYVSAPIR